jgi:hypothetical protein
MENPSRVIARGKIPPVLLANEEDFRHQVFDRFSAESEHHTTFCQSEDADRRNTRGFLGRLSQA